MLKINSNCLWVGIAEIDVTLKMRGKRPRFKLITLKTFNLVSNELTTDITADFRIKGFSRTHALFKTAHPVAGKRLS